MSEVKITYSYWPDGSYQSETSYQDNKLHGVQKTWHQNGNRNGETTYENGILHGILKRWHTGGELQYTVDYKNGKRCGMKKHWYKNGQLRHETPYLSNKRNGTERSWHEDGKPRYSCSYKYGKRYGLSIWWNIKGQLENERYYLYDQETSKEKYNKYILSENTLVFKTKKYSLWPNGNLKRETSYKNENRHGIKKTWNRDGNLKCQKYYLYDAQVTKEDYYKQKEFEELIKSKLELNNEPKEPKMKIDHLCSVRFTYEQVKNALVDQIEVEANDLIVGSSKNIQLLNLAEKARGEHSCIEYDDDGIVLMIDGVAFTEEI